MITREAIYKKAFENKKKRLNEKLRMRETMLLAAYESQPRLKEINETISALGARLAITALSGNSESLSQIRRQMNELNLEKNTLLKKSAVADLEYECISCRDSGHIGGKICECIKLEAAKITVSQLSESMPLDSCCFENFDLKYYSDKTDSDGNNARRRMTSIFKLCKEYVLNFSPENSKNLLFMGNAGLGKTHLTLAIVKGVIEKGYLPVYGSAENLFSAVEAEKFSGEGRGSYEAMLNCDLLVIDDLGAEMSTSFTKSVLYNLVNTRILSRKPTIINTNLTMKDIAERYTARISSRLIGNYESQKFLGNDIRQQKILDCRRD